MIQNILNEYQIKETVGKGTFSKVKLGINKSTGEKVAIKILDKRMIKTKNDQIRIQRELTILRKINHINIVKIIQTKEDQDNIYIIMEFIDYDLFLHIINNKRLDEAESSLYYFQLISGLEHIHSLNIVHRDLKPENLLLTKRRVLKIIDFGLSNFFYGEELLVTPCGSPSYTPPEMIKGYKYNGFAVDIWTTGIILYGMMCGYLPFEERDNKALFKKIVKCKVIYPKYISNNAQNLLKRILVANPDKRITISEIKKHPFYLEGKNIFYKRYPDLVEKLENENDTKLKQNCNFNEPNKNDKISQQNDNNNNKNFSISEKKRINTNVENNENDNDNIYKKIKEKSSSPFSVQKRHLKNKANFELLKRVLRGSRADSLDKELIPLINGEGEEKKDTEEEEEEEEKIKKKDGKKVQKKVEQKTNYSPIQLIRKINKERQKYEKRNPQITDFNNKSKFFKDKILKENNYAAKTIDYEDEKNMYNNDYNYTNTEINNKDNLKMNKTNTFNRINNDNCNKKYSKNRRNNDFLFGANKTKYKHYNTIQDEEKSISLSNYNLYNDYKYNNYNSNNNNFKLNLHKYNYSINVQNETSSEYLDSFREYDRNKNSRMRSYIINNTKIESAKNKSIINKKPKKTKSPTQSKYSGLSEKIISFNNLYNSIQNKLEKYNEINEKKKKFYHNYKTTDVKDSLEIYEKDNSNMKRYIKKNIKKNKKSKLFSNKSQEHRRRKLSKNKNEKNLKYSPSDLNKRLKSFKNSKRNSNSKYNIIELENCKSKKYYLETSTINSNNNNSIFQRHKNLEKIIKKHKNHNNPKKVNNINIGGKKYNIQEIIKRRGLDKSFNIENNNY